MYTLTFERLHSYVDRDSSVSVPVVLRAGGNHVELVASIDTGASNCLFEASFAAVLGLDLTDGLRTQFRTANSSFEAFGHDVEVSVLGILVHSLVYFFADPAIRKNVLGRHGWLDRVRLGIVDYDREIFVAPYDDLA